MPYPSISKIEVRTYLLAAAATLEGQGEPQPQIPAPHQCDEGADEDWDSIGSQIALKLQHLMGKCVDADGKVKGSEFEALAGPPVHQLLPEHPALADPEFWNWLAITYCQEIVDWRYGTKRNPQNFGVGGAAENFPYRLWLRAEVSRAEGAKDEYELARMGDVDFWRSHIFRQGYGEVRHFARALVKFQFPIAGGHKPRLKVSEIRGLAKRLKRARSNLSFEVMSEGRALRFIESEWERLASPV